MPDTYALFGHPVSHSWSPFIHGMFARDNGQTMVYRLHDSTPERFRSEALEFFATGGLGANVTLPHKQAAVDLVNELTPRAQQANAVNTIVRRDQTLLGDNTDGTGLVIDLKVNLGLDWTNPRILLLGAGGAARGVVGPLLELAPKSLVIANRTAERATVLAGEFESQGPVSGCQFAELGDQRFDLIVNATSASLRGEVPPVPAAVIGPGTTCYDMAYGTGETPFTEWGRRFGAKLCVQGWGMLVEQAAESFRLWRGIRPETGAVLQALQSRIKAPRRPA